jgi:hypothetical protein
MNRIVWLENDNVFVVRKGKTSNKKISDGSDLVQTYTFSKDQWLLATTSKGFGMKKFFAMDGTNCMDCPYSGNQGKGGCYTHKFNQYVGFLSMLRSIKFSDLTPLDADKFLDAVAMCKDSYVRFGTYGEPSLLNYGLVKNMAYASKSWTGYTHQWKKVWALPYSKYFMASTHNKEETYKAKQKNYRSFIASTTGTEKAVTCPASAEAGFKSNCASCGLCSGTLGKGKKDIKILEH